MSDGPPLRLSVLDQAPISAGSSGAEALHDSVRLARLTDALGYHRYWVAEHHGTPMLACASPEALIGADRRRDDAHSRRQRRRHAAALQPAQGRRDLQHAERALPRAHRSGIGPRAGHRSADGVRPAARPAAAPRRTISRSSSRELLAYLCEPAAGGPPLRPARGPAGPARAARSLAARLVAAERRSGPPSSGCRTRSPISSIRPGARSRAATASSFAPSRWQPGAAR